MNAYSQNGFINMNMFICRTAISILLINFCCALYQDQIGKFDWRKRFLGCPHQTWFGYIESEKFLLTISKENVIGRIDIGNGEIVWRQINDGFNSSIERIELLKVEPSSIMVKFGQKLRSFDPHTGTFQWQKRLNNNLEKKEIVENGILKSKFDIENNMEIYDKEKIVKFNIKDPSTINELKVLHSAENENNHYKIFIHWKDCRMEIYEFSQHKNKMKLLWSRPESLATISDVLLVDLPLSESQAQIESEFNLNEPILRSFGLRIWSQLEQLHRFLLKTIERSLRAIDLILFILQGYVEYSALFQKELYAYIDGTKDEPLERDYFNMRKIIVVSTFAGTLHGLSSDDGKLLWTFQLGNKFMPYKNKKVPLYLLRGTAFYQWGSQAATVFNLKNSIDSTILTFNPITGQFIDKIEISGGLSRVEFIPFVNSEQLHSLIIRRNSRPNNVELWPPPQNEKQFHQQEKKPIYLMDVDQNSGNLKGYEILIGNKELLEKWCSQLPNFNKNDEIIESIQGKHSNVKMHSPGRVLGDRSVLYKYANPNLVAILSSNKNEMTLRLNLIDSVSGELIYTGKYSRALPPFHLVHCENWIVVTYWNEKARRTEIGIIELFEGDKQTNSTAFDSLSPIKEPVKIISQSYIFSQGISAMAVSDTEQGLTSRSILIGTPFGGIVELSRRLLDARRPLEMTSELREEMLIPYIPELPMATEDLINYNQTVAKIRSIRTTPSGLESSSLVFVYGLDLFYTRIMPSGTFDILKDDFDYAFISAVMVLLTVASYICKRISRYQSVQKAWE